jgi:hypothetical protein
MAMKTPSLRLLQASAGPIRKSARHRSLFVSCLTILPLFLGSPSLLKESAFAATPESASGASVTGITGANAQLNGTRLISGATLFRGDIITCGQGSSAALQFKNGGLLAAPGSELIIESEGIRLRNGRVQVRVAGANAFPVAGPSFHVNVAASGGHSGLAEVLVDGEKRAQVAAVSGVADILAAGSETPYRVRAGEVVGLEAANGEPPGGQTNSIPAAGQVSRLLPDVQIGRASQQMVASIDAPVYWNDDLRSGPSGRARVSLTDGSLLSLGSNSELHVLQHDAQAQQTSLDLAVGRMRGQVMKLSRPGAKFEVRTSTGVAGLVGTDFYLLATPDYTELIVFEGIVRFTPFATAQPATASAGMKVRISQDGTILGPVLASALEMQDAKDSTDVPPQVVAKGTQPAGKASPTRIYVISALGVGGGIAAGLILSSREHVSRIEP